ncbi:hypothetical protein AB0M39_36780 [Streptomyces sp. NPDC051907]|uniref:hypothetical protein n=1 Tax=Streptomyces sp. NPDC051907 TaxID=3155284 RepID=UPI00344ABBAA
MSPDPRETRPTRPTLSAAELNTRIRELWADGELPDERRPEYEALVLEWAAATHLAMGRAA